MEKPRNVPLPLISHRHVSRPGGVDDSTRAALWGSRQECPDSPGSPVGAILVLLRAPRALQGGPSTHVTVRGLKRSCSSLIPKCHTHCHFLSYHNASFKTFFFFAVLSGKSGTRLPLQFRVSTAASAVQTSHVPCHHVYCITSVYLLRAGRHSAHQWSRMAQCLLHDRKEFSL